MGDTRGDPLLEHCPLYELYGLPLDRAAQASWARSWGLQRRLARVAWCMLKGHTDHEAAEILGVSRATVRTYVREVHQRAGTDNRVKLLISALRAMAEPARCQPHAVDDKAACA